MSAKNVPATKLIVVGAGPGSSDHLTKIAVRTLKKADIVYSSKDSALPITLATKTRPLKLSLLPQIRREILKESPSVVVFFVSGDPGLFSIANAISNTFRDMHLEVIPGISTLQYLAAKTAKSWENAEVVSLHSNKTVPTPPTNNKSVLFLTAHAGDLSKIAELAPSRPGVIGADLGSSKEQIIRFTNSSELSARKYKKELHDARLISVFLDQAAPERRNRLDGKRSIIYGVGLGPGDPDLITLKAANILQTAAVIFYPVSAKLKKSIAYEILNQLPNLDMSKLKPILFPMSDNSVILKQHWEKAADIITRAAKKHSEVVFVTLGDPSIYSTFGYLRDELKKRSQEINFQTIPGITAASAVAAEAGIGLVEGREDIMFVPFNGEKDLPKVLNTSNTVVLYKFGRHMHLLPILLDHFQEFVLALDVGRSSSRIIIDRNEALETTKDPSTYLATLILKYPRINKNEKRGVER